MRALDQRTQRGGDRLDDGRVGAEMDGGNRRRQQVECVGPELPLGAAGTL
jgi:hypothetical protein